MTEGLTIYGQNVQKEALSLTEQVKSLKIVTLKDFELSGEFTMALARVRKGLNKYWEKSVSDAKQSYDTQRALRDADLKPVEAAEEYNAKQRSQFKMEQDRIERAKQEKLEQEAREKADKERQALMDKAAEIEKLNPKKAEALFEKAAAVIEKPVFVEKVVEKTTVTNSGGRITWISDIKVTIINPKLVCEGISKNFIPVGCAEFKGLKAFAKMGNIKGEFWGLLVEDDTRESKRI